MLDRNGRCIRKLQERFQGLHFRPAEATEERTLRKRDAEKCKLKAMEFISSVQQRRSEEEKEAIAARRRQIMKTIRAVHVTEPEGNVGSGGAPPTKQADDFFNEYNLRLWRSSVPSMEERTEKLQNAFGRAQSVRDFRKKKSIFQSFNQLFMRSPSEYFPL